MNVCEQRSPAEALWPLCRDTLSRNVALSEQRRDNGSLSPQLAALSPPHMSLVSSPLLRPQLSFPPPPAWSVDISLCHKRGCPISGSGSDSQVPHVYERVMIPGNSQQQQPSCKGSEAKWPIWHLGFIQIFEIGLFD